MKIFEISILLAFFTKNLVKLHLKFVAPCSIDQNARSSCEVTLTYSLKCSSLKFLSSYFKELLRGNFMSCTRVNISQKKLLHHLSSCNKVDEANRLVPASLISSARNKVLTS
jgi:hypothetical protein